jgi:polysaccharide export outer membrane protein
VNVDFVRDAVGRVRRVGSGPSTQFHGRISIVLSVAALLATTWVAGCSHKGLPENFRLAVPAVPAPVVSAEIPLGIGDVIAVSYFKSFAVDGPYRLGTGDVLEVALRRDTVKQPYRLGTGDQIDVVVHGASEGGNYQLQVGDEVSIVVPARADLSHQGVILRDGSIVLPVLGRVEIRGMTVPEAVAALERRYRAHLNEPRIDLLVTRSVVPQLRENVTVLPDGTGTVPRLGSLPLRGRTVDEVAGDLSKRYGAYYYQPKVDVLVTRATPTVNHKVTLLPDGRVTLPLVGAARVGGMTVEEASAALTKLYRPVLDDTVVDVLVIEPGARIDDFFDVLIQSPLGAVREATITDDGLLRLPLIAPIKALDRPFAEVSEQIDRAYAEVLPELEVTPVFALRLSQRRVSVLGEVIRAGVFDILQPISVLEALAMAGGFTDRAWRGQVLLLHPDYREKTMTVRVLNMSKGLRMIEPLQLATVVRPHDIIYVPRTRIGDINVFVQQYISGLIPFNLRVEITFQ